MHAYGVKYSAALQKTIPYEDLKEYVRHKFVLYDDKQQADVDPTDLSKAHQAINAVKPSQYIEADSPEFQVKDFDLNFIKLTTNYTSSKFLVYNDSFQEGWHASINGKPIHIYRANFSFKAIELPQGRNEVVFHYAPWRQGLYLCLIGIFMSAFIYLVYLCLKLK
jgi:hypothetical protein